jgi:putative MATE family efflux protein
MNDRVNDREIRKSIYAMILPIIIENILQMVVNIISMGMIGRISVTAISAQGICATLTGITWSIFKGISIGTTVLAAKAYGSKNNDRLRTVIQQSLLSLTILSIMIQQILFWNGETILKVIFNPNAEILAMAVQYLKIYSFGFPFVAIMLCVTGSLQGMGNAKTPMLIALIMNVTNIILSHILIFGRFGFPAMGLPGAALAIIISQGVGAICGISVLFGRMGVLHGIGRKAFFKPDFAAIKEIYTIGIPSGLETAFWQLSSIVLGRVFLSLGEVSYAANQLGLQAESISEMPALGFGIAATAFTGQALGAGDPELGKRYMKEIRKGALLVISFGMMLLLVFPKAAMSLLTDNQEVIELGAIYLRIMGLIQIPQNLQRIYTGSLKGAGYTRIPMMVAGIGIWGVRIPLSLLLTQYFHLGIIAVWIIVAIDQTFRFALSYLLFKRKKVFAENHEKDTLVASSKVGYLEG